MSGSWSIMAEARACWDLCKHTHTHTYTHTIGWGEGEAGLWVFWPLLGERWGDAWGSGLDATRLDYPPVLSPRGRPRGDVSLCGCGCRQWVSSRGPECPRMYSAGRHLFRGSGSGGCRMPADSRLVRHAGLPYWFPPVATPGNAVRTPAGRRARGTYLARQGRARAFKRPLPVTSVVRIVVHHGRSTGMLGPLQTHTHTHIHTHNWLG